MRLRDYRPRVREAPRSAAIPPRSFRQGTRQPRVVPALAGAAAVVVAIALLHFARLEVLLLPAMPLALALVLPFDATFFTRLVIAVAGCFCLNFAVAWLVSLVSIPFVPVSAAIALAVPLAIAIGMGWLDARRGRLIDGRDGVALGAGLAVLLFLWLPTASDSTAAVLGRMSPGEDNSAHLGIVQAIVEQRGLILGQIQQWNGRLLGGMTAYPPAFHVNVALVVGAIENLFQHRNAAQLVRTYFYVSIGMQAVWATTMVMAIGALGALRRGSGLALAAVAVAVAIFFLYGPPGILFLYGFQPQVAALWMLTFVLYVAATPVLNEHPMARYWLALAGMVGTTWSWYLVSPVAWAATFGLAVLDRRPLLTRWPLAALGSLLALILTLPPFVAALGAQAPSYINGSGGVYLLDRVFVAVLVCACLVLVILPSTFPRHRGRLVVLAALLGSGIIALAIHWYQIHTAGTANYFYEKVLYSVVIVSMVGAGAVAFVALSAAFDALRSSRWRQVAAFAGVLAVAWLATGMLTAINPGRAYLAGIWTASDPNAIQHILDKPAPAGATQVLFWGDVPPRPDYFSSRFAAAFYLLNSDDRNAFMANAAFIQDDSALRDFVERTPGRLWLITSNPGLRDRLIYWGFSDSDFQKIILEVLPQSSASGPVHHHSVDFSARALYPNLFRTRCTAPPTCWSPG